MFRFLVGLLDGLLDRLVGPTWRDKELSAVCPICEEKVYWPKPHRHDGCVVRMTDWPDVGVLVTLESKPGERSDRAA